MWVGQRKIYRNFIRIYVSILFEINAYSLYCVTQRLFFNTKYRMNTKKRSSQLLLYYLVCSFLFYASCQPNKDSGNTKNIENLNRVHSDSLEMQIAIANKYVYVDLDSAAFYIDQVLATPRLETILSKDYYKHFLVKAWVHHGKQQLEEAKKYYLKANEIVSKSNNRKGHIELWINLGALYEQTKDTSAMAFVEEFMTALDTSETRDDKIGWILGHQYKARIYGYQKKYDKALTILLEALEIPFLPQFPKYSLGIFKSIGIFQKEIGDFKTAEDYLKTALEKPNLYPYEQKMVLQQLIQLYIEVDSLSLAQDGFKAMENFGKFSMTECYHFNRLQAVLNLKKTKYSQALTYLDQSKQCANKMQDQEILLSNLLLEAKIRSRLQQGDVANNLIKEAQQIIDNRPTLNSIEVQSAISTVDFVNDLSRQSLELVEKFDNHRQLEQQQQQFLSNKKVKEIVLKYEATQKEQENQILKKEAALKIAELKSERLQKTIIGSLLGATLLLLNTLFKNFRLKQQNNKLLEAEKQQLIFQKEELQILNQRLRGDMDQLKTSMKAELFKDKYEIKGKTKNYLVEIATIMYIESDKEGTRFFIDGDSSKWSKDTLKEVKASLPEMYFIQIFRSILVNKTFIKWVNHTSLSLSDDTQLKISRTYKDSISHLIGK